MVPSAGLPREAILAARRVLATSDPTPRALIDRLFDSEEAISADVARDGLGSRDVDALIDSGLARGADGALAPLARIDRVGRVIVASDRRSYRRHRDFVVGPGPASFLLASMVEPGAVGRALDLGCGSGVQGLLLAARGAHVLGLDVSPRALAFSRFNTTLNGFESVETRPGDFLADAGDTSLDRAFDLVVANPPFVLAPSHELVYRDRPLPGDGVTRRTVERTANALATAGRGYVLGNWIDDGRADWSQPIRGWLDGLGVDVVVTRVAEDTPARYAARWTRDLPADAQEAAASVWSAALEAEGVRRIQLGVISLRRPAEDGIGDRAFDVVDRVRPAALGVPGA